MCFIPSLIHILETQGCNQHSECHILGEFPVFQRVSHSNFNHYYRILAWPCVLKSGVILSNILQLCIPLFGRMSDYFEEIRANPERFQFKFWYTYSGIVHSIYKTSKFFNLVLFILVSNVSLFIESEGHVKNDRLNRESIFSLILQNDYITYTCLKYTMWRRWLLWKKYPCPPPIPITHDQSGKLWFN